MRWIEELEFDANGLIPVVAQEAGSGEVLMLAYANREALEKSLTTGRAHYWSRSRGSLWQKGESSGHIQEIVEIRPDCDGDAILYRVHQTGPACHTLESSCFYRRVENEGLQPAESGAHLLSQLEEIVRTRQSERPAGSYTTYLFDKGIDKILKKVGEETTEVVIAAKNADSAEMRAEVADLLFHLLVLLRERELPLAEIWQELEARFGKKSRIPENTAASHPHS